jgi:hypothetical protein
VVADDDDEPDSDDDETETEESVMSLSFLCVLTIHCFSSCFSSLLVTTTVHFTARSDPLVELYKNGVRFWATHTTECWTAVAGLVCLYLMYAFVWVPWQDRRAAAADEKERRALAEIARGDATRLAAVEELQKKAEAESASAETDRRELEREKRLAKLNLKSEGLAGHRLGTAADHNPQQQQQQQQQPKPKQKKPEKQSLRPTFSHLGGGGGFGSYKPSGAMRKMGGGGGG